MGLFGKKYKCSTCGASFKSESELRDHGKIHMKQATPTSSSFRCDSCGISFSTDSELRQHVQRVHGM